MTRSIELSRVLEHRHQHDFGVRDQQGRALGARIDRFTVELHRDQTKGHPALANGICYIFEGRLVRDGEPFGSGRTMLNYFDTREERDAKVAQYLHYAGQRIRQRAQMEHAIAKAASASAQRMARKTIRQEEAALVMAALIARLRHASARG